MRCTRRVSRSAKRLREQHLGGAVGYGGRCIKTAPEFMELGATPRGGWVC